jgi:hypothetical protein
MTWLALIPLVSLAVLLELVDRAREFPWRD